MYENEARFMTSAPAPYPPVAVREKNSFYAALLAEDLAAQFGELTTVHQYVFQSWLLDRQHEAAARLVRNIARVEMLHLNILGELITLLGCTPNYGVADNGRCVFWNGAMLSCEKEPSEMFAQDILLEKAAIRSYSAHAEQIQDARIQTMLHRLILDEQLHLQLFDHLLADFA